MQVRTKFLTRPIQLLYTLELHCDNSVREVKRTRRADAKEFRPRRNAAAIADGRIQDINATDDDDESDV